MSGYGGVGADGLRSQARRLRECVAPGEIYNAGQLVISGAIVRLERSGDEYTLRVRRAPSVLDAVALGMLAEAFGVADGSEPASGRRGGDVETVWRWRERIPV